MRATLQYLKLMALVTALILAASSLAAAQADSPLMVSDGVHVAHILPTPQQAKQAPTDNGRLIYHTGGVVMIGSYEFYEIFWIPAALQNGNPTMLSAHYQNVQNTLLHDYPGHTIGNNNTQYYQRVNNVTTYLMNRGGLAGAYVDTQAYPVSGCNDPITPGNCISDAQLVTELQRVMTLKGWTAGINKMYLVFTSSGEGSCMGGFCAYTDYCAYHSYAGPANNPIIYGNEPYGDTNYCQNPGVPSPNNDPDADTAATAASHEMTEALTDPELDAWYTAMGNEIGDLCAYNYGANTWLSGMANQAWNGHYFEIQMEYDNHTGHCVQVGP